MSKLINLTGQKFGRWTVLYEAGRNKRGGARWLCKCDCGTQKEVNGHDLLRGHTKSCGCLQKETVTNFNYKHGMCGALVYNTWRAMQSRCNRKSDTVYKYYGGRGIRVCKRWDKFENFYADMGDRPKGKSIDRKDNDGDYRPDNCRWATRKEQGRNRRSNIMIKYAGKSQCIATWGEELGIPYLILWKRLQDYSPQIAFNM